MKVNRQTIPLKKGKTYAELMLIGDVHVGSPQCDVARFEAQLEYCLSNDRPIYLMGDMVEASTRYSVGSGVYEQAKTPFPTIQDQFDYLHEKLAPLAQKGLIMGALSGNHEFRVYKETGYDAMKTLCRELKIAYMGDAGWNWFQVGSETYTMYALHGATGSRYIYTKLKALVDISHSFDADILAMGHVHSCADTYQLVQQYDKARKTIIERKKLLVITGHYLKYGGYVASKGYSLEKLGSPLLHLYGDKRDVHISW